MISKKFVQLIIIAILFGNSCEKENPTEHVDVPNVVGALKDRNIHVKAVDNQVIANCSESPNDPTPKYSLSPDGSLLLKYERFETNKKGRYVKDGVSYGGRKLFELNYVLDDLSLSDETLTTLNISSRHHYVGFAWSSNNTIHYKPLRYPAQLEEYHPTNGIFTENGFNDIDSGIGIYNQSDVAINSLLKSQREVNYAGWKPNIFGEKTFRQRISKTGDQVDLQLYYPSQPNPKISTPTDKPNIITILSYNRLNDRAVLYPAQNFSLSSAQLDTQSSVSHFYYLTNKDRNYAALYRADENDGRLNVTPVFEPAHADIIDVSLNRDGSQIYWAKTDNPYPKYKTFTDKAQILLDIIQLDTPHTSKIISMDDAENRVIIRRESMNYGLEYLLVSINERKAQILSRCFDDTYAPWADVEAVTFQSSDGINVSGYLYKPPNTIGGVPTIIYAHGGPSFREHISWDNLYYKSLVDNGYAVFTVNYRGSTGYGRRFRESGWKNFKRSRLDLIEAANYLIDQKISDPERMAVMGNSYGGFLVLSIITLDEHPFAAAISRNGISDLISFFDKPYKVVRGRKSYYDKKSPVFGDVSAPKTRQMHEDNSAVSEHGRLTIPLLLVHARDDKKIPFHQSSAFYEHVTDKFPNIDVQFLPIVGGHNISQYETLNLYNRAVIQFLQKHFTL